MRQGRARGKRGKERASSAAALIGSRPLDVLIALAWGCRQGPVAIALALGGGGCTGGDFFFFCWGREGGGDHTLVPAAPCTDSTGVPLR